MLVTQKAALVIDGSSLTYALECEACQLFVDVALACRTVICCRATPMQKTSVVNLFKASKELKHHVTLAVGDGANDVGMIQAAHVGVGISGHEGLQASCASDYSIAQFRFLQKLLFVHGVWSYIRLSKVILYSFYKNICLYLVELWFATQNGFSGHVLFDRWTISLYNVIFTVLPPLVLGIFDRPVNSKSLMAYPKLYKVSQSAQHYNTKVFWIWILNAVFHSLVAFWLVMFTIPDGDAKSDGVSVGQWFVGVTVYTIIVVIVCCKAGLMTEDWTWLSHLAVWGSIVLWLVFLLVYCHLWPHLDIGADMFAVDWQVYSSGIFWFLLIVVPVIALLVDFLVFVIRKTVWKSSFENLPDASMMFSARYSRSNTEAEGESIELVNFSQREYQR
jgi:phospholipid-transporting ATPase